MAEQSDVLLKTESLCVDYWTDAGRVRAVDKVSFELHRGEVLGLAGESGSGKSTLAKALMRILGPPGVITGGHIWFEDRDVTEMNEEALRAFRWQQVSMVFQSAMNALNPVSTVGDQIVDTIQAHKPSTSRQAGLERARELLELVGIAPDRVSSYPHQLSGGMRQRVVIAVALALNPTLLIMDEPTTALDVVVQKEILQRIATLKDELGFSILFITHDLPLMLQFCDRVGVLYGGRMAELGPAGGLKNAPRHPYTEGLMNAFPSIDGPKENLKVLKGASLSLLAPPSGCRFHPRCPYATDICSQEHPALTRLSARHEVACHHKLNPTLATGLGRP